MPTIVLQQSSIAPCAAMCGHAFLCVNLRSTCNLSIIHVDADPLTSTIFPEIISGSVYTADQVGSCCYFDKKSSPNWQAVDCDQYNHVLTNCGRNCKHPDRVCSYYEMDGGFCRVGYKCCSGAEAGCAGRSEGDSCHDSSARIEAEFLVRNHFSGGTCKTSELCHDKVHGDVSALSCEGSTATDARKCI